MKKLAFSGLLAASLLGASEYNYEVTPVVGYIWNSTSNEETYSNLGAMGGVDNHALYGVEVQMNNLFDLIKPEISILYGRDKAENQTGKTGVLTTLLNGVYEIDTGNSLTPFVKAGLGYEWYTNTHPNDYDGFLVDAGLGVKAEITKQIALKLEGLYMYKINNGGSAEGSHGEVHNIAALAGLTFSFDEKAAPIAAAAVAAPVVAAVVAPVSAPTPKPVVVPAPAPSAPIDSDKDGVIDPLDKCPGTPAGFKVDSDGCPIKATLHLNFKFDTDTVVDADGTTKVDNFAKFMKESPSYNASIVGHTDSVGKEGYNQKLSEKRAAVVKSMLVDRGVEASRLSTSGMGETQPIATNKTKAGRAENRRIEVDLTH
jgi:OmpA-OmpF porin, OOP family